MDFSTIFPDNSKCFCGSQSSYADCHKKKIYRNAHEISVDQSKFMHSLNGCSFFDGVKFCSAQTISSHSIQRGTALKLISERGHLMGFSTGPNARPSSIEQPIELVKIGLNKASTFQGFCPTHDNSLFKPIESLSLPLNYSTALSLAYRAQTYESVIHSRGALFLGWLQQVPKFNFQFDNQSFSDEIKNFMHYSAYSWELSRILERIRLRVSVRKMYFYLGSIKVRLPFAAVGSFCIETDFLGRRLQSISAFGKKFNFAQFSILPQSDGTTFFCLSAVNDRDETAARGIIQSLSRQKSGSLAQCLLALCVVHCENTYFSPVFVQGLTANQRISLIERFDESTLFQVGAEKAKDALTRPIGIPIDGDVIAIRTNVV